MRGHAQDLLNCRCTGAATVENDLVQLNDNNLTASWTAPLTIKLKSFLDHHRKGRIILIDVALDVVNWYEPILITTKEELHLKIDGYDMAVLGKPLNRKIIVDIHNTNGNAKLDKNKKKLKLEKLVFDFVVVTVEMLKII